MVSNTVRELGRKLELLMTANVPEHRAFELLSRRVASVEEQIALEVMRECADELRSQGRPRGDYADSNILSA